MCAQDQDRSIGVALQKITTGFRGELGVDIRGTGPLGVSNLARVVNHVASYDRLFAARADMNTYVSGSVAWRVDRHPFAAGEGDRCTFVETQVGGRSPQSGAGFVDALLPLLSDDVGRSLTEGAPRGDRVRLPRRACVFGFAVVFEVPLAAFFFLFNLFVLYIR